MNPKTPEQHSLKKRLLLVIITIIITTLVYLLSKSHQVRWLTMTQQERIEDTSSVKMPLVGDSIKLVDKTVSLSKYGSDYSAESWYSDYKANRVAFDKNYNEQLIDIHGIIYKINNNDNCAEIVIKGSDELYEWIKFTNCINGKDKWSDEVINTTVGQEVHIRGIYSSSLSDNYEMHLYKCHIIND